MGVHDLDQHLSHIGGKHHEQNHHHNCIYHLDRILGEWPRSQSRQSTSGELLRVDILIVPRAIDEAEWVARVIRQPVIGSVGAIVIRIVKQHVNPYKHTRTVVAHHQHITEQHHQHEHHSSIGRILQVSYDFSLVSEFFYPEQSRGDQLKEVEAECDVEKGDYVHHPYHHIERELIPQVFMSDLLPVIHHTAPPLRIVPPEEAEHDIDGQKDQCQDVEAAMGTSEVQFLIEEGRSEGQGKRYLQLDEVEKDHVEQVPEEREGGQRINVETAIVPRALLFILPSLTLLVQQSLHRLLQGRRDRSKVNHPISGIEVGHLELLHLRHLIITAKVNPK